MLLLAFPLSLHTDNDIVQRILTEVDTKLK